MQKSFRTTSTSEKVLKNVIKTPLIRAPNGIDQLKCPYYRDSYCIKLNTFLDQCNCEQERCPYFGGRDFIQFGIFKFRNLIETVQIGTCADYRESDCTKFGILGPSELSVIGRCRSECHDYRGSDCMKFGIFRIR